jgi:hypothetical protein
MLVLIPRSIILTQLFNADASGRAACCPFAYVSLNHHHQCGHNLHEAEYGLTAFVIVYMSMTGSISKLGDTITAMPTVVRAARDIHAFSGWASLMP